MTIYIASSWRNQHAVEMLTQRLEEHGMTVKSFVRESTNSEKIAQAGGMDAWIESEDGYNKFRFDTDAATQSDLVIYIAPAGTDAWAEVGSAWACNHPILGLWAKGESSGLMRRMITVWFYNVNDLLNTVINLKNLKEKKA